ncbi:hypothetical protein TGPRC2_249230 [Toxoplasma gondii TgCatPRC2]|uniref:Transmembrane protein n=1 Tax=Toxoplasma gondii TgCatPRC2 TaxID=1130821 RepID=A0A151HFG5_TOXGO|nr:hypothetical protein TGPRC2_249230 [Toxoplasma gondii TgCatPRC2]
MPWAPTILILAIWSWIAIGDGQSLGGNGNDDRGQRVRAETVLQYGISLELKSRVPDALLSSPLLAHSDSLCLNYKSFHVRHPSYFPAAVIRYGHFSSANIQRENKPDYFEDTEENALVLRDCHQYVLQGNLTLCGNLHVDGRLSVMPGVNGTRVFDSPTPYLLNRCLLHSLPRLGSLKFEGASLFVSGSVQIGGSLTATEVLLDSGAEVLVGMRGAREAVRAALTGQLPSSGGKEHGPSENRGDDIKPPISAKDIEEKIQKKLGKHINHLVFFRRTYEPMDKWVSSDRATLQAAGLAYADSNRKKTLTVEINCPILGTDGVPATEGINGEAGITERVTDWPETPAPVGDVVSGKLVISRSSQMVVFGNIRADASEIYGASRLNSVCGNYLSDTGAAGLITRDASIVTLGGLSLNLFSNLYVRGGSYFYQTGPGHIAFDTQVNTGKITTALHVCCVLPFTFKASASDIYFTSNLLTSSVVLDNLSEAVVGGSLDAISLVSLVEASELLVMGSFNSTALTLFDGSNARIAGRVFDAGFVKLESNGFLHTAPTETAHVRHALKLAHSSTMVVDRVPLLVVDGMVEVTNSDLQVKRGGLVARSSIILNEAHLQVNGSLAASGRYFTESDGITRAQLETEPSPVPETDTGSEQDTTDDAEMEDDFGFPGEETKDATSVEEGIMLSSSPETVLPGNSGGPAGAQDDTQEKKQVDEVEEEETNLSSSLSVATEWHNTSGLLQVHRRLDEHERKPLLLNQTQFDSDSEENGDSSHGTSDAQGLPRVWNIPVFDSDGEDVSLTDDMLSNVEEKNSTRVRLPALAAVRSSILVGGQVYLNNTFSQLAGRSKLTVFGKGGIRVSGGGSLQLFKGGLVEVRLGDVTVDSVLSLLVHSNLEVHKGSIYCGDLYVRTGSTLAGASGDLMVNGGAEISGGAEVRVRHWLTVQRESLHVMNGAVVSAEAIGSAYGDIYCGAGSVVQSISGEIIAQRHIIAQDRCKILASTYILAKEGMISLENRGYLEAKDTVLAPDAGVRRTIESEIKFGRGHVDVQVMQVSPPDHLRFHPVYHSPLGPELDFEWHQQEASLNQRWPLTEPNTRLGENALSEDLLRQALSRREKALGED